MLLLWKSGHRHRPALDSEQGLTIIEILVSMMVFSVISAGVAGTLIIGLSSTLHSRLMTMAQFAAQRQVEDMRSRPYYVPYSTDPGIGTTADIDFLSHYFPDTQINATTDANNWSGWYEAGGGDAFYTKLSPADHNGLTLRVETRFINNQLTIITPSADYDAISTTDNPPSNLTKVTVTATWTDQEGPHEYKIDTIISGDNSGNSPGSCEHASNSYIDVSGGNATAASGSNLLFINLGSSLFSGTLGDAHATTSYGCVTSLTAIANGINFSSGAGTYLGPTLSLAGPPNANTTSGQQTVTKSTWPTLSATATATARVSSTPPSTEAAAQGDVLTTSASFNLKEVDGLGQLLGTITCTLGALLGGQQCWDFLNPVLSVSGTPTSELQADLNQSNGSTEAKGTITYPQINILPLQKASLLAAPNALQGVMFFRDLTINSTTIAGVVGNVDCPSSARACNELTYSATVGMFNPDAPSSCAGDACYNLYSIDQDHPLQSVIDLTNTTLFLIQSNLFSHFWSASASDISAGSFISTDMTTASLKLSNLISIQSQVGDGLALGNLLSVLDNSGAIQVNIGSVDASVVQKE